MLGIALLVSLWETGRRFLWEAQTPFYGDASAYFAMGRAITNGFTPYRDLMEIKPPGIFFLTALSFFLADNESIAFLLRMASFAALPGLFVAISHFMTRGQPRFERTAFLMISGILGLQLTLHTMLKAGGFQTEAFGIIPAVAYVFLLAAPLRRRRLRTALLALCILAAVGLKEPFLLTLCAAALLVTRTRREFLEGFAIPLLFAAAAGIALLFLFGYAQPYLSLYLPVIFGDRIIGSTPFLLRGFRNFAIFDDLTRYHSRIPLAGYAIVFLTFMTPALRLPARRGVTFPVISFIATAGSLWTFQFIFEADALLRQASLSQLLDIPRLRTSFTASAIIGILCVALLAFMIRKDRRFAASTCLTIAAVTLATLAAGIGNFLSQHILFVLPLYASAFAVYLRWTQASPPAPMKQIVTGIVGVLLFLTVFQRPNVGSARSDLLASAHYNDVRREYASTIDTVMDRCGYERYLPVREWGAIAFTRHSPLDLPYVETRAFAATPGPALRARYFRDLAAARFLVVNNENAWKDAEFLTLLEAQFTETPPACAAEIRVPEELIFLYRK